jgi:heme-degrading monooxygenase HmoA
MIASTPSPPYYAVIFTSLRTSDASINNTTTLEANHHSDPPSIQSHECDYDNLDYSDTAQRMELLAAQQPGYLGHESVRDPNHPHRLGITVSYWSSLDAIRQWKQQEEHMQAQSHGQTYWYTQYKTRICKVERDYGFEQEG